MVLVVALVVLVLVEVLLVVGEDCGVGEEAMEAICFARFWGAVSQRTELWVG